jgi:hypothetical protein
VAVAGMDLELCARYRLGESAGVLERDGGVGVPVVDRRRYRDGLDLETIGPVSARRSCPTPQLPVQSTGVRAADAGAIRGYETQSELVGCAREDVRGQPGIGQPVAEQNRSRTRLTRHLNRDDTAVGPTQLHPDTVSCDLDLRAA